MKIDYTITLNYGDDAPGDDMTNRKGHIVQVIAPDGTTSDTLIRDEGGSARRAWSRKP